MYCAGTKRKLLGNWAWPKLLIVHNYYCYCTLKLAGVTVLNTPAHVFKHTIHSLDPHLLVPPYSIMLLWMYNFQVRICWTSFCSDHLIFLPTSKTFDYWTEWRFFFFLSCSLRQMLFFSSSHSLAEPTVAPSINSGRAIWNLTISYLKALCLFE